MEEIVPPDGSSSTSAVLKEQQEGKANGGNLGAFMNTEDQLHTDNDFEGLFGGKGGSELALRRDGLWWWRGDGHHDKLAFPSGGLNTAAVAVAGLNGQHVLPNFPDNGSQDLYDNQLNDHLFTSTAPAYQPRFRILRANDLYPGLYVSMAPDIRKRKYGLTRISRAERSHLAQSNEVLGPDRATGRLSTTVVTDENEAALHEIAGREWEVK